MQFYVFDYIVDLNMTNLNLKLILYSIYARKFLQIRSKGRNFLNSNVVCLVSASKKSFLTVPGIFREYSENIPETLREHILLHSFRNV